MPYKIIQTLPILVGVSTIRTDFDLKRVTFETQNISMTWRYGNDSKWKMTEAAYASNTHINEVKSLKKHILEYLDILSQRITV